VLEKVTWTCLVTFRILNIPNVSSGEKVIVWMYPHSWMGERFVRRKRTSQERGRGRKESN
jgi:hypothetical protein